MKPVLIFSVGGLVVLSAIALFYYLYSSGAASPRPAGLDASAGVDTVVEATATETDPGEWRHAPSGVVFRRIPAGTFMMGCVPPDSGCEEDEKPRHEVTLTKDYWLAKTETTVSQYGAFVRATGRNVPEKPGFEQGDDHPVVNVSWDDAVAFCSGAGGRLPTEAEWERAARGNQTDTVYPWGNAISHENANYGKEECCEGLAVGRDRWVHTSPTGSFEPNAFGLYDMIGNVWEWCADWYDESYYGKRPRQDPKGAGTGELRVLRGGSWVIVPWGLRASGRDWGAPDDRLDIIGFRCARDVIP